MKIKYKENITLGMTLKISGFIQTGGEAKTRIQQGEVRLNGEVETQRGKKLTIGDYIEFNEDYIEIIK
ncbi:S4 domain protein [Peptostreptococcaceae bacterium oral taxon 113 str. W5053]|nr:S4 domain protein [Peptostreptococcaceae bacterium oral taxon 113 str. W5053]